MKWALGAMLAALAVAVTVNALLLGYGRTRNDPVGRLSPVANLPVPVLVHHRDDQHGQHADD
ncbi:MAG TPA: hypothetical protein VF379_04400 [Gaiellaceae bacterium]|jgi:hypothetical protein